MQKNIELTLPKTSYIWRPEDKQEYSKFKKNTIQDKLHYLLFYKNVLKAQCSDLAIIKGGNYRVSIVRDDYLGYDGFSNKNGEFYTQTIKGNKVVICENENLYFRRISNKAGNIRPILNLSDDFIKIINNKKRLFKLVYEVEFGEYPQFAVEPQMQELLDEKLKSKSIKPNGKPWTLSENEILEEYEYNGRRFIQVKVDTGYENMPIFIRNRYYVDGDYIWIEIMPVKWLVDFKNKQLFSKIPLLSGIKFNDGKLNYEHFEDTSMYKFLNECMLNDLLLNQNIISLNNNFNEPIEKNVIRTRKK